MHCFDYLAPPWLFCCWGPIGGDRAVQGILENRAHLPTAIVAKFCDDWSPPPRPRNDSWRRSRAGGCPGWGAGRRPHWGKLSQAL